MNKQISVRNVAVYPQAAHPAKIQTRRFKGRYRRLRMVGGGFLLGLYFLTAWVNWGNRQAVWWDLSTSQFHILHQSFWAQDLIYLAGILVVCAVGLFLATVVVGRVWCGYACPQSVWTWLFMWAENITEGERHQRIRLDSSAITTHKLVRRLLKHSLWLAISFVTGFTFVGYFVPIRELFMNLISFQLGAMSVFWIGFFTLATYLNAGWLREKVCFHMCPYGRFQSSMLDADSQVITYNAKRGEPRGSRKRETPHHQGQQGDCIDCQMCVQVCPTGIDIREGLQMECIGCAACIDACDNVMDKMNYPRGLIRYVSKNQLNGLPKKILRPRVVGYSVVLVLVAGVLLWDMATRTLVEVSVVKDRMLYRYGNNGSIENVYLIKVSNKDQVGHSFSVSLSEAKGAQLQSDSEVFVRAGQTELLTAVVAMPTHGGLNGNTQNAQAARRSAQIQFDIVGPRPALSSSVVSRFTLPR